jgi:hypothetical protein
MRLIALNALKLDFYMEADCGSWDEVIIVKETPLFDIDGNITSYCFDLRCDKQTSYIIISANSSSYPVKQFAAHATSAYLEADNNNNLMYYGPGQYYQVDANKNSVLDITTGKASSIDDFNTSISRGSSDTVTKQDYFHIAQKYISGEESNQPVIAADTTYKNLSDVPNYGWYKGCVPTAMAMILDYHYDSLFSSSNALIEKLASNMNTTAAGSTNWNKVASGTKAALSFCNRTYTSMGFASANILGYPNKGSSYNTFSDFKDEIMAGRPVFIAMNDAQHTTGGYSNGFQDHAVTGVGFNVASSTNYVIVHTTYVADGDVQVPVNSTAMGDYAWFFFVP